MLGAAVVYLGLASTLAGLLLLMKPIVRLGAPSRSRGAWVALAGGLLAVLGFSFPASDSRVTAAVTRLDELVPVWQFSEHHTITVAAPPERVFEAIRRVRADEIFLFRTLTWIRRGGRPLPGSILQAGERESLIDVALRGGFVKLADDAPRELVIGTVVLRPPDSREISSPNLFGTPLQPGFALAAMNFVVTPDGEDSSKVSTETRVYASGPAARRRFAAYWRTIYPGSAIIRRMWLRAIRRRATDLDDVALAGYRSTSLAAACWTSASASDGSKKPLATAFAAEAFTASTYPSWSP